jgi:hypothetical protein
MAQVTRAVTAALGQSIDGELVPGPFAGSDMQLTVRLANGLQCSVLPDADMSALYEVVSFEAQGDVLHDKLSTQAVVECLARLSAGNARNVG